jgi:hypothetical protein
MVLSAELELAGLIFVLYIQDTVLLLNSNEGVLTYTSDGRWKLSLGSTNTRVMGKNLYVPNLLTVHRPHYRMRWSFEADEASGDTQSDGVQVEASMPAKASDPMPSDWSPNLELFQGLGIVTMMMAFIQFVAFPAVMFLYQTDASVIVVLVAIYLTVMAALALVWSRMDAFGLTSKKYAGLCFECLICPPIAINLVRRFSVDLCRSADLVVAAQKLVTPESWQEAQQALGRRIEDQLSLELEDTNRYSSLKRRLEAISAPWRNIDDHK